MHAGTEATAPWEHETGPAYTVTFSTPKKLERLYLFGNAIALLPDDAFHELPQFKIRRLEDSRIATVFSGVFGPHTRDR